MSKILVVDDDVASCRTLQLHLHSQGHKVLLAHCVDDGLDSLDDTFDLIILDHCCPIND